MKWAKGQWRRDSGRHHLGPGKKTVEQIGKQPVKDGPGWHLSLDGNYYVTTMAFVIPPNTELERMVGTFELGPNAREIANPNGLRTVVITPSPDALEGVWTPFNEEGFIDEVRLAAEGFHQIGTLSEDSVIEVKRAQA